MRIEPRLARTFHRFRQQFPDAFLDFAIVSIVVGLLTSLSSAASIYRISLGTLRAFQSPSCDFNLPAFIAPLENLSLFAAYCASDGKTPEIGTQHSARRPQLSPTPETPRRSRSFVSGFQRAARKLGASRVSHSKGFAPLNLSRTRQPSVFESVGFREREGSVDSTGRGSSLVPYVFFMLHTTSVNTGT